MALPFLAALAISAGIDGIKSFAKYRSDKSNAKRAETAAAQNALKASFGQPGTAVPVQEQGGTMLDSTSMDEQIQRKLYDQIFGSLFGGGKPGAVKGAT